jgi:hypothetical protein
MIREDRDSSSNIFACGAPPRSAPGQRTETRRKTHTGPPKDWLSSQWATGCYRIDFARGRIPAPAATPPLWQPRPSGNPACMPIGVNVDWYHSPAGRGRSAARIGSGSSTGGTRLCRYAASSAPMIMFITELSSGGSTASGPKFSPASTAPNPEL